MKKYFFLLLLLSIGPYSFATHMRAAEIIASAFDCQSFTYTITIKGYTDTGATVQFGGGEVDFGDGTIIQLNTTDFDSKVDLSNDWAITTFQFQHAYPGPGTYTISFREFNRNVNILNMERSVDTPFYVETQIVIDPLSGCNSSPEFLFYPLDGARLGHVFKHNPGAIDPDLDSLSYEIVVNRQSRDLEVNGYLPPNDPSFGGTTEDGQGSTTLTIDKNGTLNWNAPGQIGEYTLAIKVTEWRNLGFQYYKMGYVIRDMQIIVEESDNDRPHLIVPADTTLLSGVTLKKVISVASENEDSISMVSKAQNMHPGFITTQFNFDNTFSFSWDLKDVPFQPFTYPLVFFSKNDDQPPLTDFATWNVTVINQYNENLNLERIDNETINVSWNTLENATGYELWRKLKIPQEVLIVNSDQTLVSQGFQKVGEFAAEETSFLQNVPDRSWNNFDVCYQVMAKTNSGDTTLAQKCLDKPTALVLSIAQISDRDELRIYPNPFQDVIRMHSPKHSQIQSVTIYNLTGVNMGEFMVNHNLINLAKLTPGSYILKITTDQEVITRQVVKK